MKNKVSNCNDQLTISIVFQQSYDQHYLNPQHINKLNKFSSQFTSATWCWVQPKYVLMVTMFPRGHFIWDTIAHNFHPEILFMGW